MRCVYDCDLPQFTSKERDAETGLDYFGLRYMSSAQGRFTSPDPVDHPGKSSLGYDGFLSEPQRWSLYAYALNNPLHYVDTNGAEAASFPLGNGRYLVGDQIITASPPSLRKAAVQALVPVALAVGIFAPEAAAGVMGWAMSNPGQAQRYGEMAADAIAPPGTPSFSSGIGSFARVTGEVMSARSAIYQSKIAGTMPDVGYIVDGVKFDGFKNGVLLDAKAGYAQFVKNGSFASWFKGADDLVSQAQRQVAAAKGGAIQWHFAEQSAADATRKLLKERKISGIEVMYTPE